ncbi:hypothetical protein FQO85_22510 [Salmonella enterica]|uniref:Morphogenetic protein n=2 Tax=Salmonella enterica I TaxID=59201 RepID=A0A5U3G3X9_SALET|nr:hypothetical protein [Salmonella enterica]EBP4061165.1 hypothetical protein [Salmonella enterica subsp. enterica]EBU7818753.1 hypothetical protein [Salmonella enterica subsp. enterica serovar Oranienburg]EBY9401368.1 hypothetical protein [Salmonella enterica subsp. enterica serovar Kisarawe]ECB4059607.1 hypothetical protein [Salmonella enterica subsp. enterica serovar Minnesota]ECI5366638.1 hypothetical protein [Salmonella enterica subsp. diarizonae]ECJ2878663.1 hypothetical protein [Salmo
MKERGMIFNAEMVSAILSGRKTQTRRPIKWKQTRFTEIAERDDGSLWPWAEDCERGGDIWFACPYGEIGDRIWVRETFRVHSRATDVATLVYRASVRNSWTEQTHRVPVAVCNKPATPEKWTPSIHMPRWASRILLEITDVRVERLRDLNEEDAKSEGITPSAGGVLPGWEYRINFRDLWMDIYGTDNWEANPWVWVIEFKRVEGGAA